MKMRETIIHAIDWTSIKLNGVALGFAVITWSKVIMIFTLASLATTIFYNLIRIYKEIKNKKQNDK